MEIKSGVEIMVDYPEEIENPNYARAYMEKFNQLPAVKDNNLKLVDASINSFKNFLVIFYFLIIVAMGILLLLVYQGYLKPEFHNQNNVTLDNNFKIENYPTSYINNSISPIVYVYVDLYLNNTITFNSSSEGNNS